jgi:hypothetical protein
MPARTDLDHALQLRLSKHIVAEIDDVIAKVPQLCDFNRCKFIRAAVQYALDSLAEEGYLRERRAE